MRQEAGLTVRAAAERVGWNAPGVSSVELGYRSPNVEDVAALLTVYGVVDERRKQLVDIVKSPSDSTCWRAPMTALDPQIALSLHEKCALGIVQWGHTLIPDLLQTSDYARAQSTMDGATPEQADELVTVRAERLQAVRRVPYLGLLGEEALRTPVGGPVVHRRQLQHLADMSRLGMVRVVRRLIAHSGLHGPWTMLRYNDGWMARLDILGSPIYLTGEPALSYEAAQTRLIDIALSPEHSHALITSVIGQPALTG